MDKTNRKSSHVIACWIRRLLLVFVVLLISRWALYWLNSSMFATLTQAELWQAFWQGVRFDGFVLSIIAIPSFLYYILLYPFVRMPFKTGKISNIITFVLLLLAVIFNLSDAIYYRFTLKRLTYDIVPYLFNHGGGLEQLPSFLVDFWYITFAVVVLAVVMAVFLFGKRQEGYLRYFSKPLSSLLVLLSAAFLVVAMRGGLQLKPIRIVDAGRKVQPQAVPLVLNTPFTLIKTYGKQGLLYKQYFHEKALQQLYNPIHQHAYLKSENVSRKNVVVIILESFSLEHIAYFTHKETFTPFLDSLFAQSLTLPAIANGKRSIEGIPAVLSALPTLGTAAFLGSAYAGNRIQSIASYLKPYGYHSAFFHGGKNGTMSFDAYAAKAGFDDYYGFNEYPNKADFDGQWGVWDIPYFEYVAYSLTKMSSPFVASLFSLSSHHPYQVPKAYKNILPKGNMPIKQTIAYTDMALRRFFAFAQQQPWYSNTLFVITADHTSETDPNISGNAYSEFRIPIAFFAPSDSLLSNKAHRTVVQQTDIFPSIADYLRCDKPLLAFGNSIFDTSYNSLVVNRFGHYLQFFSDSVLLQWQEDKVVAKYHYRKDSTLQNPIPENYLINSYMIKRCKAYQQQYNNRMIENRLLPNEE